MPHKPEQHKHACECEHTAHFNKFAHTPHGNLGHKYATEFENCEYIKTTFTPLWVCQDCKKDCMERWIIP